MPDGINNSRRLRSNNGISDKRSLRIIQHSVLRADIRVHDFNIRICAYVRLPQSRQCDCHGGHGAYIRSAELQFDILFLHGSLTGQYRQHSFENGGQRPADAWYRPRRGFAGIAPFDLQKEMMAI